MVLGSVLEPVRNTPGRRREERKGTEACSCTYNSIDAGPVSASEGLFLQLLPLVLLSLLKIEANFFSASHHFDFTIEKTKRRVDHACN